MAASCAKDPWVLIIVKSSAKIDVLMLIMILVYLLSVLFSKSFTFVREILT
jgi:hypothetical protein